MPTAKPDYLSLVAHPLANMFPMIEGKEFDDLKNSVRVNGILVQIVLFQGMILDGRNRYAAANAVAHDFAPADFREFTGTLREAEEFVIAANINRRNLTNAQKAEVIRQMIQKNPGASNRQIAKKCGMSSHSTVAAVREKLVNPPELKRFRDFKSTWEDLPDEQREEFVKEFLPDLREIMNALADGSSVGNLKVASAS
jgi:hypothetical protein